MQQFTDAVKCYKIALDLDPTSTESVLALASDLVRLGEGDEANTFLATFAERAPDNLAVRIRLATIAQAASQFSVAEAWYLAAQRIDPDNEDAHFGLIDLHVVRGQIDEAIIRAKKMSDRLASNPTRISSYIHLLNYAPATTPADVLDATKLIRSRFKLSGPAPTVQDRCRQLRIGIVSRRLNSHPANFFITPALLGRDPDKLAFEMFAVGVPEQPATQQLRGLADQWHDITDMQAEERARAIRARHLDIVISPTGHEEGELLDMFQARLAPVQMTAFAAFCTTGIPTMDGFISDWHETPQGAEKDFSEAVLRMPDGYIAFLPPDDLPDLLPAPDDGILFGSFNNISKICRQTLALWQRILAQQAGSRLLLKTFALADEKCVQSFSARLIEAGIDPESVILEGSSPRRAVLERYRDVDVALDPLAYSGGVTTLEALWMGVPVITLPGTTFARRHSLSHLTVAGLEHWVAGSGDEYVEKALEAADRVRNERHFRQSVRDAMQRSPTSDAKAYARDFEHAVRTFTR